MKISKEHFEELKFAIEAAMAASPNKWDEYKKNGLTAMRFRWDALHLSDAATRLLNRKLYQAGLNDDHVDTALRRIMTPYMA